VDIWNSRERLEYLLQDLKIDRTGQLEKCIGCAYRTSLTFPEDRLDNHAEELYKKLSLPTI
jgi:hypothetical protein